MYKVFKGALLALAVHDVIVSFTDLVLSKYLENRIKLTIKNKTF